METRILIYLIFVPLILMLVISFLGFWQATHPPKIISQATPKDLGWHYEDINLKTSDGVNLSAWFVPSDDKNSHKAIIALHGYPADKGDLLDWAAFLKNKYHLLFLDFRYFGRSEGSYTSLGIHETKDVLSTIKFLKEDKNIKSIGLMGFSFGGSVALLTLPDAPDVKGVVADSPFANLDLMGKVYYGNIPFLHKPLTVLTKFYGRVIYGLDAQKAAVDKVLPKVSTPILIIASQEDDVVSIENSQRLKEALKANKRAGVVILTRGPHGFLGGINYQKMILDFFEKHL